jgi:endonuclease/exonuclease/phosphatase family metal-dependent hydrolase
MPDRPALRVATWNLLHGLSPSTGQVDPELLARQAALLECDVLAIQEVDQGQPRSGNRSQTDDIAHALGAADARFLPALSGTPGGRWDAPSDEDLPHYGIGLISRLPVRHWHTLALPSGSSGLPLLVPTERGPRIAYVHDEPRMALAAELDHVTVACVHLSFVPGRNIRQLRHVVRWLRSLPGPHLLMGDFNLPGALPRRVTGWHSLARTATYPSWQPRVQFDHVLSSTRWPVVDVRTPTIEVSDHRPLVVTLAPIARD